MTSLSHQNAWSLFSYKDYPASQQPKYPDLTLVDRVLGELSEKPPLVAVSEVQELKRKLASIARGDGILLHAGDCAELFSDCNRESLSKRLSLLYSMRQLISHFSGQPVTILGRMAGQYFKPRSKVKEQQQGDYLCPYRGDGVNELESLQSKRVPNPHLLLDAYSYSDKSLNFLSGLISQNDYKLMLDEASVECNLSDPCKDLLELVKKGFSELQSIDSLDPLQLGKNVFVSHEGLVLGYEQALTRLDSASKSYYDLSSHMLWIGNRTRSLGEGHLELFRGVENPIGIKVDNSSKENEIVQTISLLNPLNEPGKICLITRLGAQKVSDYLPGLIQAVESAKLNVLWMTDPMHGNTYVAKTGFKTRTFDAILTELAISIDIHQQLGTHFGGIHLEISADRVTECLGGADQISDECLKRHYKTGCDPRLNSLQSLETAAFAGLKVKRRNLPQENFTRQFNL